MTSKNDKFLSRDEYSFHAGGIMITQDAMGIVSPGSGRTFGIYFEMVDAPEDTQLRENEIVKSGTNFLRGHIVGEIPLGYILAGIFGVVGVLLYKKKQK